MTVISAPSRFRGDSSIIPNGLYYSKSENTRIQNNTFEDKGDMERWIGAVQLSDSFRKRSGGNVLSSKYEYDLGYCAIS